MKRIFSVLTVLAIMAAMLVASAIPAFAIGGPPYCGDGQIAAFEHNWERDPYGQGNLHGGMMGACFSGTPPGEVVNNN